MVHLYYLQSTPGIIISTRNENEFICNVRLISNQTYNWCQRNVLTLNLEKTYFIQFHTNHQRKSDFQLVVSDATIPIRNCTKFLDLSLDSKLSWNVHSSELTTKLNKACYAIRAIKSYVSLKILISIYFPYFHSLLTYGIIFWGSSHSTRDIFKIQKSVVRIITSNWRLVSCRPLFKQLKILTLPSQYIYSVLVFVAENRNFISFHLFAFRGSIQDYKPTGYGNSQIRLKQHKYTIILVLSLLSYMHFIEYKLFNICRHNYITV